MTNEELVRIIRSDDKVGRGSCSTLDECYGDAELVEKFGHLTSRRAVLRAAYASEDLQIDRMLDARFGDDDDAEVKIAAEWRSKLGETKNEAKARRARSRRAARRAEAAGERTPMTGDRGTR